MQQFRKKLREVDYGSQGYIVRSYEKKTERRKDFEMFNHKETVFGEIDMLTLKPSSRVPALSRL